MIVEGALGVLTFLGGVLMLESVVVVAVLGVSVIIFAVVIVAVLVAAVVIVVVVGGAVVVMVIVAIDSSGGHPICPHPVDCVVNFNEF